MMTNRRGISAVPIIAIVFSLACLALAGWMFLTSKNLAKNISNKNSTVICTVEAKICPDGSTVGRTGPNCQFAECPVTNTNRNANPRAFGGCVITGCSGQICSDKGQYSTCEIPPGYSCYQTGRCERQNDGNCGWKMTTEMQNCLQGENVICPQDVKSCPGGSDVGRMAPNCEFAPC